MVCHALGCGCSASRLREGAGGLGSGDWIWRDGPMKYPRRSAGHIFGAWAARRLGFAAAALRCVLVCVAGCGHKSQADVTQATPIVKNASVVFPDGSPQLAAFVSEPVEVTRPITHNL